MITVALVGKDKVVAQLRSIPPAVATQLLAKVWSIAIMLQSYIRSEKLSGQVLNVVSGALRRSINVDVKQDATQVLGRVFSSGDVKYAGIHEFGGTTKAHTIMPRKADALAFMINGKQVFARKVNHPGSVMPERSFMRSGLSDKAAEIAAQLKEGVTLGLRVAQEGGV